MRNLGYGSKPQAQAAVVAVVLAAQADTVCPMCGAETVEADLHDWRCTSCGAGTRWQPGDPCANCGSRRTVLDDDGVPACSDCHASDNDE